MTARITDIRPADENNQVVTVEGGSGIYRRQPCAKCPWRVDAVGEFPAEAFRHSAHTAHDMASFNATVSDGGHVLHDSYRAMAVANGVPPDDPAIAGCRP